MAFVTQGIEENIPENGYVFAFGWSTLRGSTINLGDESVVQMSSGDAHSSLLCASGKVYMFGSNEYAQLGLGFKSTKPQRPTLLTGLDDFTITQVACGGIHTLFLTGECQVLACGTNDSGQLGHGYVGVLTSPVLVHGMEDVVQVAAAGSHSAALTASGEVYVWGDNSWSQLAVGHSSGVIRLPTLLPLGKPVAYIGAGSYHSAFITVDGVLFTCGSNFSGQLGSHQPNRHGALHTIPLRAPVVSIACGARHTVVVLVYTYVRDGVCGDKDVNPRGDYLTPFLDSVFSLTNSSVKLNATTEIGHAVVVMGNSTNGILISVYNVQRKGTTMPRFNLEAFVAQFNNYLEPAT